MESYIQEVAAEAGSVVAHIYKQASKSTHAKHPAEKKNHYLPELCQVSIESKCRNPIIVEQGRQRHY